MLTITASAVAVVLFADRATQWTLKALLNEFAEYRQAPIPVEEVMVRKDDKTSSVTAQAA